MVLPTSYAAQEDHQERAESQAGGQWWYCSNNHSRVLQILEAVEELLADDTSLINNDGSDSAFPGTSNFGSVLATDGRGGDNSRVLLLVVHPVPPPSSIARSTADESSSTRGRHDHHAPQNAFRTRMIPVTTRHDWSKGEDLLVIP